MPNKKHQEEARHAFEDAEIIYQYTRKQALEDGVLVDISGMGRECGFKVPVAVTQRVWAELITPPSHELREMGQSEAGRTWDVLWMLFCHIRHLGSVAGGVTKFDVAFLMKPVETPEVKTLKAVMGPDDDLKPCMTIMFPEED